MDRTVSLVLWPGAPLTDTLVRNALARLSFPVEIVTSVPSELFSTSMHPRLIQWSSYDCIDHELTHLYRTDVISSSYTFRKALIRKHFLSRAIHSYVTKQPSSILAQACPKTYELEICFADELDEMWTDELWELGEQLDDPEQWWILKPGMADRGIGIRIFNSKDDLQRIFEEFEQDEEDTDEDNPVSDADAIGTAVATSQLRHFVIQEYIQNPLLFDPSETLMPVGGKPSTELHGHKFHLRAYCAAAGALQVYLYERVLALFSAVPYVHPRTGAQQTSQLDLSPHLTNTSLQTYSGEATVRLLDEMVGCQILSGGQSTIFTKEHVTSIADQMTAVLGETFKAALQNPIHFQPLPNAFELYGVDFLVTYTKSSSTPEVKILEVNAEPAIELTGSRLSWILEDLFVSIAKICIEPFFEGSYAEKDWAVGEVHHHLIKCLDERVRGPGQRE